MGTLWMMDSNKDGRFSLQDLLEFGRFSNKLMKSDRFKQHELSQQLQAQFTLKMYQNIFSEESNEDDFVAWLSRVMQEN